MALVIPGGYALGSITLNGASGTQPFVTTLGVNINLIEGNDLTAAANELFEAYVDAFKEHTFDFWTIQKASVFVHTEDGSGSTDSTLPAEQGTRTGRPEPIGMALIMRKNTGGYGRTARGRMFIPGVLDEGDVQPSGALEPTSVTKFTTAGAAFMAALMTDEPGTALPPFLLHDQTSPVTSPTPIASFTPSPLVGWIRKRIR